MSISECLKCGQPLVQGLITAKDSAIGFATTEQGEHAMFRTRVQIGRACLNCGYLELFLDPKEFKDNIAQEVKHKKK